jgi:hypothetical protein
MQFRNQQTNRTTKLEKEITLMKTQLLKTIMAPLVVACALVTMVAPTATGQGHAGGKLQGTWNVTVNACNNGPTITRLNTFMFGGTMQEFAAFVSPLVPVRRGPGQGVWEHLTDGNYSYTVKFFVLNADSTLAGWRIEMRDVVVDGSGSSYTATGTSQLYDINGNPVGPAGCATETATRLQ